MDFDNLFRIQLTIDGEWVNSTSFESLSQSPLTLWKTTGHWYKNEIFVRLHADCGFGQIRCSIRVEYQNDTIEEIIFGDPKCFAVVDGTSFGKEWEGFAVIRTAFALKNAELTVSRLDTNSIIQRELENLRELARANQRELENLRELACASQGELENLQRRCRRGKASNRVKASHRIYEDRDLPRREVYTKLRNVFRSMIFLLTSRCKL